MVIRHSARRLRDRKLPKCIDIYDRLVAEPGSDDRAADRGETKKRQDRLIADIRTRLIEWSDANSGKQTGLPVETDVAPRILVDFASRTPYKPFRQTTGPLNQILIRGADNVVRDMAHCSPVVAAIEEFKLFRAYVDDSDQEAKQAVEAIIAEELGRG